MAVIKWLGGVPTPKGRTYAIARIGKGRTEVTEYNEQGAALFYTCGTSSAVPVCEFCGSARLHQEDRDAGPDEHGNLALRGSHGSWTVCGLCGREWPSTNHSQLSTTPRGTAKDRDVASGLRLVEATCESDHRPALMRLRRTVGGRPLPSGHEDGNRGRPGHTGLTGLFLLPPSLHLLLGGQQ